MKKPKVKVVVPGNGKDPYLAGVMDGDWLKTASGLYIRPYNVACHRYNSVFPKEEKTKLLSVTPSYFSVDGKTFLFNFLIYDVREVERNGVILPVKTPFDIPFTYLSKEETSSFEQKVIDDTDFETYGGGVSQKEWFQHGTGQWLLEITAARNGCGGHWTDLNTRCTGVFSVRRRVRTKYGVIPYHAQEG